MWQVVLLGQLLVLAITTGKKKIQSSVCWVRGSGDYDRKKKYSRLSGELCCCISVWFWREISIFFVVAGNFDYDWKKKRYSRLSSLTNVYILGFFLRVLMHMQKIGGI